jgi:uncharacterized protein (DUF2141 family)
MIVTKELSMLAIASASNDETVSASPLHEATGKQNTGTLRIAFARAHYASSKPASMSSAKVTLRHTFTESKPGTYAFTAWHRMGAAKS